MLLYLSIFGVFLSVILLFYNKEKSGSTFFLGFFFFSLSMYALSQYILLYSKSFVLIVIFLKNFACVSALPFVIGPMFYWYIRSVLYDNSELKITDSVHLLLMALYFVISVPQNLAPLSDKISDAITLLNNTH